MKTYIVTGNPPTSNGDLHVGHLSGPYLGADIFTRFQRMQGQKVAYLSFGDDHQSFVVTTAIRKGCRPEELVKTASQTIQNTLKAANIELDHYGTALNNKEHIRAVQQFFQDLLQRGILIEKTAPIPWCSQCNRYLFESYIRGYCPYCAEECVGNLCEPCGRLNNPTELANATCATCGKPPEIVSYRGFFFPFENYRREMDRFYASRTTWRAHQIELCRWAVGRPMADCPVTYPTYWGIPVGLSGYENQTFNAWFEMYPAHLFLARKWGEENGAADIHEQLLSGKAEFVQFCGFDNTSCNALLHPGLALSTNGRFAPPHHVMTNEFYLLDGEKFSTSRNHAIWGGDILREVQADALRFHVARTNPEHRQTSFSYREFVQHTRRDLAGLWTETVNRAVTVLRKDESVLDAVDLDLKAQGLLTWASRWLERYYGLEEFSPRQASAILQTYVEACAAYANDIRPDMESRQRRHRSASFAYLIKGLSYFAAPLLPRFAQDLWGALGFNGRIHDQDWHDAPLRIGRSRPVEAARTWFTSPPETLGAGEAEEAAAMAS